MYSYKPRVTVGIPCFNAERWLGVAVESALAQTCGNVEVIVVDDGSSDRSPDILRAFGSTITKIRTKNQGPNSARNEILRLATGEYIQYLDADDYLLPNKIRKQLCESESSDSVVYSPVLCEVWCGDQPATCGVMKIHEELDVHCQLLAWELPQTGGVLWKTEALRFIGGWGDEDVCDEHELYFRALKHRLVFKFAPTPGAVYRVWSEGTRCRSHPAKTIDNITKLLEATLTWLDDEGLRSGETNRVAGRTFFQMARSLATIDMSSAELFHNKHRSRGLINLDCAAAPYSYRLAYELLGFYKAERVASKLRNFRYQVPKAAGCSLRSGMEVLLQSWREYRRKPSD